MTTRCKRGIRTFKDTDHSSPLGVPLVKTASPFGPGTIGVGMDTTLLQTIKLQPLTGSLPELASLCFNERFANWVSRSLLLLRLWRLEWCGGCCSWCCCWYSIALSRAISLSSTSCSTASKSKKISLSYILMLTLVQILSSFLTKRNAWTFDTSINKKIP